MTEAEWHVSTDPWNMLQAVLETQPSERRVRLFNVAICRHYWDSMPALSQSLLTECERLADEWSQLSAEDQNELLTRANSVVMGVHRQYPTGKHRNPEIHIRFKSALAVEHVVRPKELFGAIAIFWSIDPEENRVQCDIIREIFGSLVLAEVFDHSWRTDTAVTLARQMYDSRDFSALPILADDLHAAGCHNEMILNHCRGEGVHVRGCWVLDRLLGKS